MATSRTDFTGKTRYAVFALVVLLGAPQAVPAQGVPWQNTGNNYGAAAPQGGSYPLNGHIELPSVYGRGRTPANSQPNIIFPCGAPYSPMGPGAQQPGAYYPPASNPGAPEYAYPQAGYQPQPAQPGLFAPAGTVLPVNLMTAISMKAARKGTVIKASVNRNVQLQSANSFIPAGTVISGIMTDQQSGHLYRRSDDLTIVFDKLTFPDGRSFPIQAQFAGGQGTNMGDPNEANRMNMQRSGAGAELGSGLLATGALASMPLSHNNVTGGLYSSTSLFGAFSVLGNMVMNKRTMHDLIYPVGSSMQVQLTQNLSIPSALPPGANMAQNAAPPAASNIPPRNETPSSGF